MAPRYCRKCQVAFHGATCAAGHPIFMYSKTIPDGVQVQAASPTPDDEDADASPLKPAAQGGAVVHKKGGEPASSLDLSAVSSDGKAAQRELDRELALTKTTERERAKVVKKQEPMMLAIDALKRAVAEDSAYKKADLAQKSELLITVVAAYRFAIGLATEVTQHPKSKASVVKQLSEKIESVKARLSKLEAALEEGAEDAVAAAQEQVRAAAEKDNTEKIDAAVAKRMDAWEERWEQEWQEAHASGRRGALSGTEKDGLGGGHSEEDSEDGFHSVTASPMKPPAVAQPSEVREVTENLREVAAPADITGDPVNPPPERLAVSEAALGSPPSMLAPAAQSNGKTGELLDAAAAVLVANASCAHVATPPVSETTVAASAAADITRTERPKMVLSTPAPRPRPSRVLAAPYTPAPVASGSVYKVGDARRYLEASGTLAALSDALYTIAAEPETSRPDTVSDAVAYLAEKAASGAAPPAVESGATAEVSLVDIVSYDYLSTVAAPVHSALMRAEKERSIDGNPGVVLGKLLSATQLGADSLQPALVEAPSPAHASASLSTAPQPDPAAEQIAVDDSV